MHHNYMLENYNCDINNSFYTISCKYWLFTWNFFNNLKFNKEFIARENFRFFIKYFFKQLNISKTKTKNLVGNSSYSLIFFFNKVLNNYWKIFFNEKIRGTKIGSFVLIMHKFVRWLKFKKISKNVNLVFNWVLKQLILFVKLPLIKNETGRNFFWDYSIRWHFEAYI